MGLFQCTGEKALFDSIAVELNNLAGINMLIYSLDKQQTVEDPLYNEPKEHEFLVASAELNAVVKKDSKEFIPGDRGLETVGPFEVWIARKQLEDLHLPDPKPGDVYHFWDSYFDVTEVHHEGWMNDRNIHTMWKCMVRRRSKFVPERRLGGVHAEPPDIG